MGASPELVFEHGVGSDHFLTREVNLRTKEKSKR